MLHQDFFESFLNVPTTLYITVMSSVNRTFLRIFVNVIVVGVDLPQNILLLYHYDVYILTLTYCDSKEPDVPPM